MSVNETAKLVAKRARAVIGGSSDHIHRFYDEGEKNSLFILTSEDAPDPGFSTFSTVNLHESVNQLDGKHVPVELALVGESSLDWLANVVATAGFFVKKDGWLAAPGVVFPDLIAEYSPGGALPHVMWVPPFPWDSLSGVALEEGLKVHWLLGVPISSAERDFLEQKGFDELEDLFVREKMDYFDLSRRSVV